MNAYKKRDALERSLSVLTDLNTWARRIKTNTFALYLACKDPRTPWYAKVFAGCVVAYAFSPIDLIPDFIPILGYLDDLVLLPIGVVLALKMIPPDVFAECRQQAETRLSGGKPVNRTAAFVIVVIWILAVIGTTSFLIRAIQS